MSDSEIRTGRSKSNDLLQNDGIFFSSTFDVGRATLTKLNSLKLWGRNRLKLISRNNSNIHDDKKGKPKVLDTVNYDHKVVDLITNKNNKKKNNDKDKKLMSLHERKPSCSSSEKSVFINTNTTNIPDISASINPVKLRESSSLRRQRRGGSTGSTGISHKDEPHSSSGNWSASSESGRTSIGSEITIQPKSSASSTSLNHCNNHINLSSGPPSSIISRRRFLNTSASSSVTSEGTITPDLQINNKNNLNNNNDIIMCHDDETSSAYSCDTEGYYTSFHVDSGLKTLKEEDTITPIHSMSISSNNNNSNSFELITNHNILTAENEYELFGHGSTSTTTSSAGTVCTTLMAANDNDHKTILKSPPEAPERKSSLINSKSYRNNSNASNSTLERTYSSSTIDSTLERNGTIKRNGVLIKKEISVIIHDNNNDIKINEIDSPDSGNNTSSSPLENNSNKSGQNNSEFECSECSDLEGFDRIERIKQKTTINSSRIPSMCIITPTTSDDEQSKSDNYIKNRAPMPIPAPIIQDNDDYSQDSYNPLSLPKVNSSELKRNNIEDKKNMNANIMKRPALQPLNTMLGKLKGVFPNIKKYPEKDSSNADECHYDNSMNYDTIGEYVTISDVRNNNNTSKGVGRSGNSGIYYSNDIVKRNLATVLSGNLYEETEYVSLNELPCSLRKDDKNDLTAECENNVIVMDKVNDEIEYRKINIENARATDAAIQQQFVESTLNEDEGDSLNAIKRLEKELYKENRVKFDVNGKIIYNSDSLKRRKTSHTTFIPGPHVKRLQYNNDFSGDEQNGDDEQIMTDKSVLNSTFNRDVMENSYKSVKIDDIYPENSDSVDIITEENQLSLDTTNMEKRNLYQGKSNPSIISSPTFPTQNSIILIPKTSINPELNSFLQDDNLLLQNILSIKSTSSSQMQSDINCSETFKNYNEFKRGKALRRNNSYKLANYSSLDISVDNNYTTRKSISDSNYEYDTINIPSYDNFNKSYINNENSKLNRKIDYKITKSFERLINEFSLSSTSINSCYLKNKSLENFDLSNHNDNENITYEQKMQQDENENNDDDDITDVFTINEKVKSEAEAIYSYLKPFKVIVPTNQGEYKARVLKLNSKDSTDIW